MQIKVLFVTKMCDPVLYRVNIGWLIEEMDKDRFEVDVVECMQHDISVKLLRSDIIIYYRTLGLDYTGVYMAKEAGKLVGYMVDDYLLEFDFGQHVLDFMQLADFVVVPTHILRELYQSAGVDKPFHVKIHGLPVPKLLALQTPGQQNDPTRLRIGWLGGLTHHIFTENVEEMLSVLSKHKIPATLICFGKPEDFAGRANALPNIAVENLPFIPFADETGYYATIANAGFDLVVNFIPLNKLGAGKSQLKYLETGLYHVPLITANYGIWPVVVKHGVNGLLATSPADFAEKIIYLKNNPTVRTMIAENAFQDVINNYHIKIRAEEMGEFLQKFYHEHRGR